MLSSFQKAREPLLLFG